MEKMLKEFSKEDIVELLKQVGKRLKDETTIFLIGGCNMSLKEINSTCGSPNLKC
ncbi:hypothetical protein HZC30_00925 [Candidatus Woesearchaeota archaeon]|nr:hypothetical protein [Candidatus Woesearchaeota archaeon]